MRRILLILAVIVVGSLGVVTAASGGQLPVGSRTAGPDGATGPGGSGGEQRGRDNAKNVDGRKRHIVVDSMGLLLAVLVTAADVDDARGATQLFARLGGQPMSRVRTMYADGKYHNFALYEWVGENARYDLAIVRRPKDAEGWVKLPIRWTVERTLRPMGVASMSLT